MENKLLKLHEHIKKNSAEYFLTPNCSKFLKKANYIITLQAFLSIFYINGKVKFPIIKNREEGLDTRL